MVEGQGRRGALSLAPALHSWLLTLVLFRDAGDRLYSRRLEAAPPRRGRPEALRPALRRGLRHAQRSGQPAGAAQQPLGFDRHLLFLEIGEQFRGRLAFGFADGGDDLGFGDAAQVIIRARYPTGLGHVELQGFGELEGMTAFLRTAIGGLEHRIDGETRAMREQRLALLGVEALQRRPKFFGLVGQGFFPGAMPRRDRRRGREIGKAGKGRGQRILGLDLHAGIGRVVVEQPQRQRMQHGKKGDAGIVRKRVAQGE